MKPNYKIWLSYHPADRKAAEKLMPFLKAISASEEMTIAVMDEDSLEPGCNKKKQIQAYCTNANLILVLVSADYMANYEQYSEVTEKIQTGKVIPLPIRPCNWEDLFKDIVPLPNRLLNTRKSIKVDERFYKEVADGVRNKLHPPKKMGYERCQSVDIIKVRANSNIIDASQEREDTPPFETKLMWDEEVFVVEGDSMSPRFTNGARLKGKKIEDLKMITKEWRQNKKVFAVNTKREYLLKYIKEIKSDSIVLASENPEHPDFELDGDEVISIYLITEELGWKPV